MKNILIISPTPTHPVQGGSNACILSYCELLAKKGHNLSFLWVKNFMVSDEVDLAMRAYWGNDLIVFEKNFFHKAMEALHRRLFFNRIGFFRLDSFYPWGISRLIRRVQKNNFYDTIIVNYVFLSRLFQFFTGSKRLLYTHDVFSLKYQRTGQKWFSLKTSDEKKGINRADAVLAIQTSEASFFKTLTEKPVITTYAYFESHETSFVDCDRLLYIGGSNSYNIESVLWFVNAVFSPLSKAYHRDIHLIIAGRICNELECLASEDKIELIGEVDDLASFYSKGNIVVNPTFNGTGLKIKSFEALSYGKVVVSHVHGLDGVFDPSHCPIFSCSSPSEFIEVIRSLLDNRELVEKKKKSAMQYMKMFQSEVENAFINSI